MYTLRFPFQIPDGKEIKLNEDYCVDDNGLTFHFNKQDRYYVLNVEGFKTEELAHDFINNIWSGFSWLLLHRGLPIDAAFWFGKTFYSDDPVQAGKNLGLNRPIDCIIDGNIASVYSSDKRISIMRAGSFSVLNTYQVDDVFSFFIEGINFQNSNKIIKNPKLKIAFELYGAFYTEVSTNARFLTLVMAMEVLAVETYKTERILELVNKWKDEAEILLKELDKDSEDYLSLESLIRELMFRKSDSIRKQIRNLVSNVLLENGDNDYEETAKRFLKIYDTRSALVHTGIVEKGLLGQAINEGREIVERVLKALFIAETKVNR